MVIDGVLIPIDLMRFVTLDTIRVSVYEPLVLNGSSRTETLQWAGLLSDECFFGKVPVREEI